MIWSFIATCCFALVAAIIFEGAKEVYQWFSPSYINRKKLIKKIERMIAQDTEVLHVKTAYPITQREAMIRINTLVTLREIVKSI